jgi:RNA polymerase sigma factor (sigma-70 family)
VDQQGPGPDPATGSTITFYLNRLKDDDSFAAQQIWQSYFERLIPLARQKLRSLSAGAVDEEDVLLSVFDRFFRAAKDGRFAKLDDRDDLWQILLMLVDRRVADQYRREGAAKRGGGKVAREGDLDDIDFAQIRELADQGPSPEYVAEFNEHLSRAILRLDEGKTREVAVLRMEGYSNVEISKKLKISLSSVGRKMRVIQEVWKSEFSD